MFRVRTKRRSGAAALLIFAVVAAAGIGQKEWSLQTLTPGHRTRGRALASAASGGAADREGPSWTAMHQMGGLSAEIRSEDLRDSVAAGPALSASGSSPKAIADAAARQAAVAAKVAAKLGKNGRGKGGKDGKDGAGEFGDSAFGSEGGRGRGHGANSRGAGGLSGKGSFKKGQGGSASSRGSVGSSDGTGRGGHRHSSKGKGDRDGSLVVDGDGAGRTGATGSSHGHGHHGGRGSDAQGNDFFGSGNGKLKGGKGGSLSSSHSGGHGKHHGGGGSGSGKGADGDDDAASLKGGGGKKDKGGKHGGGHHGGGKGGKDHSGGRKGDDGGGPDDGTSPYGARSPNPPETGTAPDFKGLKGQVPASAQDGSPISPKPAGYKDIEGVDPKGLPQDSGPGGFKWNNGPDGAPYYCQGSVCGRWADSHWVWLQNQDGKWYMQSYAPGKDGSLSPDSPAYSRHQGHWWYQDADGQGQWSVIHNGVPWSYSYLVRWKQNGLTNPDTGAQMVYTPDGNVMVVHPGKGATIYDPNTGKVIGRKKEGDLPTQPKYPSAPSGPNDPAPPDNPFPMNFE